MSAGASSLAQLYRVVEKGLSLGRRSFVSCGGVWHPDLNYVKRTADGLAKVSLAHRLFIVSSTCGVIEEVELAPLAERMASLHRSCLELKAPDRLQAEEALISNMPAWRQRLPLSGCADHRAHRGDSLSPKLHIS